MKKYSKSSKLNKVLNSIAEDLLSIYTTEEESLDEIRRYKKEFPYEKDYNLYQYGNVLIYTRDIRKLYEDYKSLAKVSDEKIIEIYKRQVGYIARQLTK